MLSLDGILHLKVVENTVTRAVFCCFIKDLLPHINKWPLPNSVLVINNVSIHKVASIHKLVKECGMCVMFLPSYSPDLSPIELSFLSIKAWLCVNCDHVNQDMENQGGMMYRYGR